MLLRGFLGRTNVFVSLPTPGPGAAWFRSSAYRRCATGLLGAQLVGFGLWQVEGLWAFLRAHSQCSWQSVVSEGHWWAGLLAHLCHRDPDHFLVNLLLFAPSLFLLQGLLSWRVVVGLATTSAAASSAGSLAFIYWAFAPAEPRRLGYLPWQPPRHSRSGDDPMLPCELAFGRPRNAFDEFCLYRDLELVLGFDTMTSGQCFVEDPEVLKHATKLRPDEAARLYRPYCVWAEQAARGNMGSSALAAAFGSACALWFTELCLHGSRHPLLLVVPAAMGVQVLADLAELRTLVVFLWSPQAEAELEDVRMQALSQTDHVGHLVGGMVGALAYACFLRRGALAFPLVPMGEWRKILPVSAFLKS